MEAAKKIRDFITKNLVVYEESTQFENDDNIFEKGFVNSLFAMHLITYLEQEFGLVIDGDDLDINNFNTVNNIISFIKTKS
ncbi:acyl carrier protein [Paenibacillus pabuli]|uniref:acyl carrier protein n=1 Tax=Paenibacillus pabuli TaxID=1472 RepID=UPI003CF06BA7